MQTFTVTKKLTTTELHEFEVEADSAEEAMELAKDLECSEESLISGSDEVIDDEVEQAELTE